MSKISSISKTGTTEPWELQVARGQIQGHSVQNIFGFQVSCSSTDFAAVWELPGPYTYPTTAIKLVASSDNAADIGETVKITGLDSNYDEITEIVTLATVGVTTTQEFFRVNDLLHINTGGNDGLITVSAGGTTYGGIRPGSGKSQSAIFTVPRGHSFYLTRINSFSADGTSDKPGLFRNHTSNPNGVVLNVARSIFSGELNIIRIYPFKYGEKTDIQLQTKTASGVHEMSAFAEGILVQEDSEIGT